MAFKKQSTLFRYRWKRTKGTEVCSLHYERSEITVNRNYRDLKGSTYDDSVGGDVQGSSSEDRGGRSATPSAGLLVGRV